MSISLQPVAPAAPMPSYSQISRRISELMLSRGEEWAGLPMPLPGLSLSVEERNPWKGRILSIEAVVHQGDETDEPSTEDWRIVNTWFSRRLHRQVYIATDGTRFEGVLGKHDYVERFNLLWNTLLAAQAWEIETETTAIDKLATLLKPHLFEAYIQVGTFIETSKRSGVTYMFRRNRPTLAFRDQRVLCALCLHGIGYYERSFAGSMCPTDDVIAHLLMMRADEPFFWRRANQHAPWRPEAGL